MMIKNQQPTVADSDDYSIGSSPTINTKIPGIRKTRGPSTISNTEKEMPSNGWSGPVMSSKKKSTSSAINKASQILGPYDILCGRNKMAYNNVGNRRFRVTISMNLQAYIDAKTRNDKASLIAFVVNYLKNEVGVRFVTRGDDGSLGELTPRQRRQKVGHALRDLAVARQQQQQSTSSTTNAAAMSLQQMQEVNDDNKNPAGKGDEASSASSWTDNDDDDNSNNKPEKDDKESSSSSSSSWSNLFQAEDFCLNDSAFSLGEASETSLRMEPIPFSSTLGFVSSQPRSVAESQRMASQNIKQDEETAINTSSSPLVDGLPALLRPW